MAVDAVNVYFRRKLGPNVWKMEFRTFVMLKKVICDQLLASKAKIIKRKLILSSTFKFSPFPLAIFSLVPDLSFEYDPVARVRKKYGCFAV